MATTVVSCREYSEKLTSSESFEAIHDAFVSSEYEFDFIIFQKEFDTIGTKFDDVSSSIWISNKVGLDSELLVTISRVRPQNVNHQLLFKR